MRFGFRVPSLTKRIAARTSLKRYVRQSLGVKAPRGYGWITNPRRALYNRVYTGQQRGAKCTSRSASAQRYCLRMRALHRCFQHRSDAAV